MKTSNTVLWASLLLTAMTFTSCGDDEDWKDVDGAAPDFELTSDHIRTEAGRSIQIQGTIADNDGIATIQLKCSALNLNKVIDLIEIYGEPKKTYDLNYAFAIQDDETGDNFEVEVTTTDIGGRQKSQTLLVTLDGDFSAPVFTAAPDNEITVLIKENTLFNLKFTATDNRAIDYIEVDVDGVDGFPMTIQGNGQKTVEFSQKLPLPAEEAVYNVTLTAYDEPAQDNEVRSTSISSKVTVSELPDFEKMYLADVSTAAELNSDVFGVPMRVDHTGAYQYRARYYNETAGTQICFIPQKTDFSPICFGPDPDNTNVLGDDPETVGRITLDKAGVYYEINFNTKTGAYDLSTYETTDEKAMDPIFWVYGSDNLNTWYSFAQAGPEEWVHNDDAWLQEFYFGYSSGPGDVTRFTVDSKNKHLYYTDDPLTLDAGEQKFIIHNWHGSGWWNYATWRVDDSSECEIFYYYGSVVKESYLKWAYGESCDFSKWGDEGYRKNFVPDNWCKPTVTTAGKYRLYFDSHLGRAKMVPAK
jgi:hypothetical protein